LFVPSEPSRTSDSEGRQPAKKARRRAKNVRSENDPLFDENGRPYKPKRKQAKTRGKGRGAGRGRPNSGNIENAPLFESSRGRLLAALQGNNPQGKKLVPSRPTRQARWETHTALKVIDADTVSKASLKKRDIPDTGAKKICTKTTGANDPENISIVNMKDIEGLTFEEIAARVNAKRIVDGKMPDMKPNAANCRYNRTAPHLYQMQGIPFVRLADRANADGKYKYTKEQEQLIWTDEMDQALVDIEHEYRVNKWKFIAKKFADQTESPWATETEVAVRFSHL
jgi:hypothetical protein